MDTFVFLSTSCMYFGIVSSILISSCKILCTRVDDPPVVKAAPVAHTIIDDAIDETAAECNVVPMGSTSVADLNGEDDIKNAALNALMQKNNRDDADLKEIFDIYNSLNSITLQG